MKLICALVVCALSLSSAEDEPRGNMIQLCGAQLAMAIKRVCVDGDLNYFNVQHQHQHNHQYDHQHDHQHEQHHERTGDSLKRDTSSSLVDECCLTPCHIKDFISYCPVQ